ncbi:MAG: hypothetical protein ACREDD_09615, partial [Methylocella sp.]
AEDMPKTCRRHAEDMPKTCRRHAEDMPKTCRRHAIDDSINGFAKAFRGNTRAVALGERNIKTFRSLRGTIIS